MTVDHASAFALTSTPPPTVEDGGGGPGIPGVGPLGLLVGVGVALAAARRR